MIRTTNRVTLPCLLLAVIGAAAPVSQGSLVCWTESSGLRNWGNCTAPCDVFFSHFGNYCNSSNNVRCYDLSGTALNAGTGDCEVCVTGYGPGVDGAGYLGRYSEYNYDGDPFFIVQRSGAIQCVFRVPSSGAVFVATLPPGPSAPPGSFGFAIATRYAEAPAYPPSEPYCSIPRPPLMTGDFAITYTAAVSTPPQIVTLEQQVFTYGQLSFRLMPPSCPEDMNASGSIDTSDLTVLLGHFGGVVTPFTDGDTNGDGNVNTLDLVALLARFGQHCP